MNWWRRWRATAQQHEGAVDLAVAAGLLIVLVGSRLATVDNARPRPFDAFSAIVLVAAAAGFALRRVRPPTALATVAAAAVLGAIVDDPDVGVVMLAAIITFGIVKRHRELVRPAVIAVGVVAATRSIANLGHGHRGDAASGLLLDALAMGVAILLGINRRQKIEALTQLTLRAELVERDREREAILLLNEERARIARDLHDVVAHAVTVMVLQADGARGLAGHQPERVDEALLTIERSGRQALDELRRVLGLLRDPAAAQGRRPLPHLDDLDDLLAPLDDVHVAVHREGVPRPISAGVGLAGYRIVQEAITNARRHGRARRVDVTITTTDQAVDIDVVDDGKGAAAAATGGHGLVGMQERAAMCNGTVEAGPRVGGGWRVTAHLVDAPGVRS